MNWDIGKIERESLFHVAIKRFGEIDKDAASAITFTQSVNIKVSIFVAIFAEIFQRDIIKRTRTHISSIFGD